MNGEDLDPKSREIAFKFAWDWLSYHASQRLMAFNFFLVIIGMILFGYFKCIELKLWSIGAFVGLFGVLISIAFWHLEIRNHEFVKCGEAALDELEKQLA